MAFRESVERWLREPEPPGLGIEFRADEVVLARLNVKYGGQPNLDLCVRAPFPSGERLEFSTLSPNLKDLSAMRRHLSTVFRQAGISGQRIALTLPDSLARIWLQHLSGAPRGKAEVEELLRFKLKKTLPFDVEEARLSFERVGGPPSTPTFLTGIMQEQVVSQYEELLEGLGFHVGAIETCSMSLIKLWSAVARKDLPAEADYFFVNIEEDYFTMSLVRKGEVPALVRTLRQRTPGSEEPPPPPDEDGGLPEPRSDGRYTTDDLLRELLPTLIYYREKLNGTALARVYYRSLRDDLHDIGGVLEAQFKVPAEPFDLTRAVSIGRSLQMDEPLADLVGAAAGAAAGRAA